MTNKNVESAENQFEIATVQTEGNLTAHNPSTQNLAEKFTQGAANFLTSIVSDGSVASKAKIYNAMNDNTGSLSDHIGEIFEVTDFMIYPVTVTTQTGEVLDAIRTVLITKSGETYGTVANGVFSSLQKIVGVVGMAPWPDAIKLVPIEKKTRMGFKTLVLRMEA